MRDAWEEWWARHRASLTLEDLPPRKFTGERFAAPTLEFDPAHADLKIALSPQLFEIEQAAGATSMWVQITAPDHPGWLKKIPPLTARQSTVTGYAKRGPAQHNLSLLPSPFLGLAGEYQVSIRAGEAILHAWTLKIFDQGRPYLIFTEQGKQVRLNHLSPPDRYWFILPKDGDLMGSVSIVQDNTPPAYLDDVCSIVLADLANCEEIKIGYDGGLEYSLAVIGEQTVELD